MSDIENKKLAKIMGELSELTIKESNDLVKLLEKNWGVSAQATAAAPVEAAQPQAAAKTEFDIKLEKFDTSSKISIIKCARKMTGLGLKEAKELVEKAPVIIQKGVAKDKAEEMKKEFETAGATISLE